MAPRNPPDMQHTQILRTSQVVPTGSFFFERYIRTYNINIYLYWL
jgi:hypothetical protein